MRPLPGSRVTLALLALVLAVPAALGQDPEARIERTAVLPTALTGALARSLEGANPAEDQLCRMCHSEVETPASRAADDDGVIGTHSEVGCVDCHLALVDWDPEELEHDVPLDAPSCAICHADVLERLNGGPHAAGGVTCWTCHGAHEIRLFDRTDLALATGRLNALCMRCHVEVVNAGEDDIHAAAFHGRTCLACHDAHDTDPPEPALADKNCLLCHAEDEEAEGSGLAPSTQVAASVHGTAGLSCVLCHAGIREGGELPHDEVEVVHCGTCHPEAADAYSRGLHSGTLGNGHAAADCKDCHGAHDVYPASDPRSRVFPRRLPGTCETCHRVSPPEAHPAPGGERVKPYEQSIHGRLLLEKGLLVSANCNSCHGSHEIRHVDDPEATTSRRHVPYTCGHCHAGMLEGYLSGVHGADFLAGDADVPVCTDCHREHTIEDPSLASSSVSDRLVAETCARCHADDELASRHGFRNTVLTSWISSYHGIAGSFEATGAANCASCHGFHAILPSSDPRSRVHPANLQATCGGCHPNAGEAFALVPVHSVIDRESNFVPWIVRLVYAILVGGVIGAFVLFILFDLFGRLRIRMGWGPPETVHVDDQRWPDEDRLVQPGESFVRMTLGGRIQHGILIASFLLLVLTGLPVFLHESRLMHSVIDLEGGFLLRSKMHRIGAFGLIGLSLWHLGMLATSPAARRWFVSILPRPRDVTQFLEESMFSLGVLPWLSRRRLLRPLFDRYPRLACRERPALGRYGLVEKLEYSAVLWGNLVMILTGLLLWRPGWFLSWTPSWTFDVCRVVHGFEATLAFLAIIVWHMYHVHLRPGAFPMSRVWLDGRISREGLRHHHPAEYLRILERRRSRSAPGAAENEPCLDPQDLTPTPPAPPTSVSSAPEGSPSEPADPRPPRSR